MKISTDAVLLGSLAKAESPAKILDIGTGTGVIALMLAQRFPNAKIQAVELDEDAASQAQENFQESPFADRMGIFQGRVQDFPSGEKFDLIVSNPPFFPDHLKSQNTKRNKALHTDELSFEELTEKAIQLLAATGAFWVILPPRQMQDLEILTEKAGVFLFQKFKVRDAETKPIYREVAGFTFSDTVAQVDNLFLKNEDLSYANSYSALLSGFLLGY